MIAAHQFFMEVLAKLFENTFSPDKVYFACCQCRLVRPQDATHHSPIVACPQCTRPMHNMGAGFVRPRSADHQQWRKVEMLVAHDFTFELLPG
ncbi:MAG: hypothetical protein H6661_07290 [Ardenticatenaceae bacterium]|nr:hypothetical protein [Ardenticatenaceae bacterium]